MIIGVPKEIKVHEYRVGLTPDNARALGADGHQVLVETQAGAGIGFSDQSYQNVGASIVANAKDIFEQAELIIKVKEPQPSECQMLSKGQVLFTYLHLAADATQTELLLASGATCIAYETITDEAGRLPLLKPMSEIAGRMSIQAGAHHLEKTQGGSGVLLSGASGVDPAKVLVIGGGVVGTNAAEVALGMGAQVHIIDRTPDAPHLLAFAKGFDQCLSIGPSSPQHIEQHLPTTDLAIGAALVTGAKAPKLITKEMLTLIKPGSVLADVAIDQGGCFETSKVTTHDQPTYVLDGVIHYCVGNMPGAVAQTATLALTNTTLPYVLTLANKGWRRAVQDDEHLKNGVNIHQGQLTHQAVAQSLGYQYQPLSD